ncbi:MAG: hypothetical protein ACJZ4X_02970 [Candidatus Thalassarchaeaceae archaeon]
MSLFCDLQCPDSLATGNALYAVLVALPTTLLIMPEYDTAPLVGLKKRILITQTWKK